MWEWNISLDVWWHRAQSTRHTLVDTGRREIVFMVRNRIKLFWYDSSVQTSHSFYLLHAICYLPFATSSIETYTQEDCALMCLYRFSYFSYIFFFILLLSSHPFLLHIVEQLCRSSLIVDCFSHNFQVKMPQNRPTDYSVEFGLSFRLVEHGITVYKVCSWLWIAFSTFFFSSQHSFVRSLFSSLFSGARCIRISH